MQADIKTGTAFGVYTTAVPTSLTVQNSEGMKECVATDAELLCRQLEAILTDFRPDAVKIGLIPNISILHTITEYIKRYKLKNVVLDPIYAPTMGGKISDDRDKIASAISRELLPLVTLCTPNVKEYEIFSRYFAKDGPRCNCLITDGDNQELCQDILINAKGEEIERFTSIHINTPNGHGTGCVFSSAVACGLAKGRELRQAIADAKQYLYNSLTKYSTLHYGKGYGPADFFLENNK